MLEAALELCVTTQRTRRRTGNGAQAVLLERPHARPRQHHYLFRVQPHAARVAGQHDRQLRVEQRLCDAPQQRRLREHTRVARVAAARHKHDRGACLRDARVGRLASVCLVHCACGRTGLLALAG